MRTYGHLYMSFSTMYHQYAKFGFMHAFEAKICNMQVYEHMNISYATMLNLWLQHLYVMIMPSSLFLSFMRYCDM